MIILSQSFCGPFLPAFGLNTERSSISLRIRSECGKTRTRKTGNTDTFTECNHLSFFKKDKITTWKV